MFVILYTLVFLYLLNNKSYTHILGALFVSDPVNSSFWIWVASLSAWLLEYGGSNIGPFGGPQLWETGSHRVLPPCWKDHVQKPCDNTEWEREGPGELAFSHLHSADLPDSPSDLVGAPWNCRSTQQSPTPLLIYKTMRCIKVALISVSVFGSGLWRSSG